MLVQTMAPFMVFLLTVSATIFKIDAVGVNYGRVADNLPNPSNVVELIKSLPASVKDVKIFDAAEDVIKAFTNSGLKLVIAVDNSQINNFAADAQAASDWVQQKVSPFSQTISTVAVGNEMNPDDLGNVISAMRNVQNALNSKDLRDIKVTTPLAFNFLSVSYPPSSGEFKNRNSILPLLQFLSETNSFFMANLYPYFAWRDDRANNPLEYALSSGDRVQFQDMGRSYTKLLDAQVDSVYAALDRAGYGSLKLVIGETGWPSAGGDGATVDNAKTYNSKIIERINSGSGTPAKPNEPLKGYIFALFNENQKPGDEIEKNWGLLYPDGKPVY